MNNMMQMMQMLRGAMQNPAQLFQQHGLPADAMKNPEAAVQQLLNSGKISQQAVNAAQQSAQALMNNPMFKQMFGK